MLCRRGFSLLELLIVLAVMAGLAAIVFPNLTKPLAESEVSRAAASLRDAIADCRNEAVGKQDMRLLRFQADSPLVSYGSWQSLASEVLDANQVSTPSSVSQATETSVRSANTDFPEAGVANRPVELRLPDEIVVEQVIWSADFNQSLHGESQIDSQDDSTSSLNDQLSAAPATVWYLPCLPTGRSKDCQIVLRDKVTDSRCVLLVDGVLRMMRIERLQNLKDVDASRNLDGETQTLGDNRDIREGQR